MHTRASIPGPTLRLSMRPLLAGSLAVFLEGLNSPFGMALVGENLYVANTDAVLRFPYEPGETRIARPGTTLTDLPAGTRNHHW